MQPYYYYFSPRGNKLRISYCLPKQTLRQSESRDLDKQNMDMVEKKKERGGEHEKEWKWCMCASAGARAIRAVGERSCGAEGGNMQRDGTKNSSLPQQLPIRAVKQRESPDARPYSAEERRVSLLFLPPASL